MFLYAHTHRNTGARHPCPPGRIGATLTATIAHRYRIVITSLSYSPFIKFLRKNLLPGRRVAPASTRYVGKVSVMAQPHKGPREQIKTRVHADVYAALRDLAAGNPSLSVSQVAADLLAAAVGRSDLVRDLDHDRGELSLAI